jgi:hypothetical protein
VEGAAEVVTAETLLVLAASFLSNVVGEDTVEEDSVGEDPVDEDSVDEDTVDVGIVDEGTSLPVS